MSTYNVAFTTTDGANVCVQVTAETADVGLSMARGYLEAHGYNLRPGSVSQRDGHMEAEWFFKSYGKPVAYLKE